ncbi:MAG: M48 family metallopeptidase [Bacteroidaceae bacterium]|nr:M48 family metallopeptidase [Bacteroidaceae bacterium]
MHKNYEIFDTELGKIAITHSKRARRIIFRGENGAITMVVPFYFEGTTEYLRSLVEQNRGALKRLLSKATARHTDSQLYDGRQIEIVEGTLLLRADNSVGRSRVRTRREDKHITFSFHPDDITSSSFQAGLSRYIMRTLTTQYGTRLRQMTHDLASQWGLKIKAVRVGRGQRVLGHCSRTGIITISAFVLLLPQHLREYIILHELAHLTHFDHSAAFHALCNKYCQGNEATWRGELRKFVFPISL